MSDDSRFLDRLADALARVRLDAVVIGNTAAALHGAPVLTEDVDLLVRDTPANRRKLRELVDLLGGVLTNIADLVNGKRIHLEDTSIDILFDQISGNLRFASVKAQSELVTIEKQSLRVAALEDVIASKKAAGRKKDRAVLPILEDTLLVKKKLES